MNLFSCKSEHVSTGVIGPGVTAFDGRTAALATRHGKGALVAPAMQAVAGLQVEVAAIDTDAFGTFAGDVPRLGTPLETAIAKARAAMAELGTDIGLASEGTIGPDPVFGLLPRDTELVVLVDDRLDLVITGTAVSHDIVAARHVVTAEDDLGPALRQLDIPTHAVLVMPHGRPELARKGLVDPREIRDAVAAACADAEDDRAVITSDLRAHCSPTRQAVIRAAAAALAARAATLCPACARPGWGQIDWLLGRPCAGCGTVVADLVRGRVDGCEGCGTRVEVVTESSTVSPARCPRCNP